MRLDRTTCGRCGALCDGHDLPADQDTCPTCKGKTRRPDIDDDAADEVTEGAYLEIEGLDEREDRAGLPQDMRGDGP